MESGTTNNTYISIFKEGLWKTNPVLVQVLGLCPLLAVSNTVVNALGLGLATILVMLISNGCVSLIRNIVRQEIRLPVFVLIIASAVTCTELIMHAWFNELYKALGIFIPLIVTNCSIIARAETFASKNKLLPSLFDGLMMGIGFTVVLLALGAMREVIGSGTLFADAHLMFGESASWLSITLFDNYKGFLLAILPPGAFMGLAVLFAAKNWIDIRNKKLALNNKLKFKDASTA
jgi:electron transport complex protein RnfE